MSGDPGEATIAAMRHLCREVRRVADGHVISIEVDPRTWAMIADTRTAFVPARHHGKPDEITIDGVRIVKGTSTWSAKSA